VNVGQVLRQGALRHPEREAIAGAASWGALDRWAREIAGALVARSVGPGARVMLCAANRPGFVAAWFGIVYAGAVVVPAPILSTREEVEARLEKARCALVLCDEERAGLFRACTVIESLRGDPLDHPCAVAPGDDAMILFTSGTTGAAKGARISHASLLLHTAALVHHTLDLRAGDRVLAALPLTHSFGCRMAMLAPFFVGARIELVERFDAQATWRALCEKAITWAPVVPTMLAAWLRLPASAPPPALRWVLSAGAPLPAELALRAERRLGAAVRQGYGLTEATLSTIDAPPAPPTHGSVGRPVWGVEVRLAEDGEILVRGQNEMSGYLDDPEATEAVRVDGWLRTGDVGRIDGAGRLHVIDRKKDLIVRGGNNVHPAEVEAVLCAHPGVAEVAVVGRPDPYWGEEVVAVVVPRGDAALDDLGRFAAARLSPVKVPRELAVVDELPLGPSGKVLKRVLRERLAAGTLRATPLSHR